MLVKADSRSTGNSAQLVLLERLSSTLYADSGPGLTQREVPAVDELGGWLIMLGRRRCAAID